jgi:hypothetical protein
MIAMVFLGLIQSGSPAFLLCLRLFLLFNKIPRRFHAGVFYHLLLLFFFSIRSVFVTRFWLVDGGYNNHVVIISPA